MRGQSFSGCRLGLHERILIFFAAYINAAGALCTDFVAQDQVFSEHPRTPESNKALIIEHRLNDALHASFIRPHRVTHPSFEQVRSDSKPVSQRSNWGTTRAIMFVAREAEPKQQVTPPLKKAPIQNVIPIAAWRSEPEPKSEPSTANCRFRRVRRNLSGTSPDVFDD